MINTMLPQAIAIVYSPVCRDLNSLTLRTRAGEGGSNTDKFQTRRHQAKLETSSFFSIFTSLCW